METRICKTCGEEKPLKVRGLLCGNCNAGIGNLRDDVERLKRAIEYLG